MVKIKFFNERHATLIDWGIGFIVTPNMFQFVIGKREFGAMWG